MKWQQIWTDLKQRIIAPCYLLGGQETYLMRQTIDKIETALDLAELKAMNIDRLAAADIDQGTLATICAQIPWGAAKRLVVVDGIDLTAGKPDWVKKLPAVVRGLPESTCLVFCVSGSFSSRHELVKAVSSIGHAIDFPELKGRQIQQWVSQRSAELGLSFEPGAVQYFVSRLPPNVELLESELNKLSDYIQGERLIGQSQIDDLVLDSRQSRVFALSDAVVAKDREAAFRTLADLIAQGESPIGLTALLAHQVELIGKVKGALAQGVKPDRLAAELSVHPYAVQKAVAAARRFSWPEVYRAIRVLSQTDIQLKSTSSSAQLVLEKAILSI